MNYLSAIMSSYLQTIHQLKEMDSPAQFRALTRAFKSYNPLATNFFNIPPNITNHPLFKNNPTRQTFLCGKDDNGDTLLLAAVKEAPNILLPLLAFRLEYLDSKLVKQSLNPFVLLINEKTLKDKRFYIYLLNSNERLKI